MIVRPLALALAVASAAGCALLSPPDAAAGRTIAILDNLPAEIPRGKPHPVRLLVFPPETQAFYDTVQMAYRVRPHEVAYFSKHEWGETPSQMLQPLLVRTLEGTGCFSAVLTPPYTGRYAYALRTEILELVQDFTTDPPMLRLSLRLQLSDESSGRRVATREISLGEPLQQRTPSAGVVAANDATARALREIARFVLDRVEAR